MFLLIDNYDSFTYNLVQAFYALGEHPLVVRNDDPKLLELAKNPDLKKVCISPGPGRPEEAGLCMQFLAGLDPRIPVLGVCLGHQLLGLHAGARIVVAPAIMHGKQSDISHAGKGIFEGLPNPLRVGRYHSLVVQAEKDDENPHFSVTARGPLGEVMALAYKDRPWVGVQFHPESVLTPEGMKLLDNFPRAIQTSPTEEIGISTILETLANGEDLDDRMAAAGFAELMDGKMSQAQAGSFLVALRMKGESALELAHARKAALERAVKVDGIEGHCLDVVGTGGDGRFSFNCSTASALVLAGMGYKVIKHGNRAVSSKCGAADAVEALGLPLEKEPQNVVNMLKKRNFGFFFAPYYHPAFKNIGPIRKELGIRTLFNILGPMINPARNSHLLMGVAKPEMVELVAKTLAHSTLYRAAVVHGAGGYDEVTALGPSKIILVQGGQLKPLPFDPADYAFKPCSPEDLAVHSKEEAIAVLREVVEGRGPQPMLDMVALNVGMSIYLMEEDADMAMCMARAREAVHAGLGRKVLDAA